MARLALAGKADNVAHLVQLAREDGRERRECPQPPLVPLAGRCLAVPGEAVESGSQQALELGAVVLADVKRIVGPVRERPARADHLPFRRRAEEDPSGSENAPRLPDHRPVVLHVLDRFEGRVEIEARVPEREARSVREDPAESAGPGSGQLRLPESLRGEIGRNDPAGVPRPEDSRSVPGAGREVEHPLACGVARRPTVAGHMLVPEPGRGEPVQRESFHGTSCSIFAQEPVPVISLHSTADASRLNASLIVALRSKERCYSSLARLVSRAPRPSRCLTTLPGQTPPE